MASRRIVALCCLLALNFCSGCQRQVPPGTDIPQNAEFTGGNWKSGYWRYCEQRQPTGWSVCREYRSDGSLRSIGYYSSDISLDELKEEETNQASRPYLALDRVYFSGRPYFPISRVEEKSLGVVDLAFFMPLECQEAVRELNYTELVDLSLRKLAMEDYRATFGQLMSDPQNRLLLEQNQARSNPPLPVRGYFLNGCRAQFHW